MKTISGVQVKERKGLKPLEEVLRQWVKIMSEYSNAVSTTEGGDAPYQYTERANIGLLAAAAWRTKGWVALEEFQKDKHHDDGVKNGRADLWVYNGNKSYLVEAKYEWICMGQEGNEERIKVVMQKAADDAKKSQGEDTEIESIALGIFPLYKSERKVESIDDFIEGTINQFKELNYHAIAWHFPVEMREHIHEKTRNHLPGVVLLFKNIKYS